MIRRALASISIMAAIIIAPTKSDAVEIQEVVSPGGVIAWLVEDKTVPLISVEFEFGGGAAEDPEDKAGLSYFVAGLLNEGAGDLDAQAYQTQLDDRAIRLYFDAGADTLSGSMQTLSENAEDAFDLLGMALREPRFDEDAVERVREQIYAIQRRESEQPRRIAAKHWLKNSFGDHPYGNSRKGTTETIAAIERADMQNVVDQRFALDNVLIGVVGDIDAETLGLLLDAAFADLPEEADRRAIRSTNVSKETDITIVPKDVPQSTVVFGTEGIRRSDPDWYTAIVMNYVLGGGGFSSRLMEEVRRKRGLAYGVSTYLAPRDRAGLYMGSVATQNARVGESIAVIREEIDRLANDGISEEELTDAKTYLTGSYPLRFGTSDAIAGQLVGIQRYGLGMNFIDRRNDYINAVTLEQVNRVAKRLLQTDEFYWVIVGQPEGLPEDLTQRLAK